MNSGATPSGRVQASSIPAEKLATVLAIEAQDRASKLPPR